MRDENEEEEAGRPQAPATPEVVHEEVGDDGQYGRTSQADTRETPMATQGRRALYSDRFYLSPRANLVPAKDPEQFLRREILERQHDVTLTWQAPFGTAVARFMERIPSPSS